MATAWSVPRMWPGKTVAILASGPSMSAATADQVRAAGVPAIAINDTHRLAPWADMLYAADAGWWVHHAGAPKFTGLKVTCDPRTPFDQVLLLRNTGDEGFETAFDGVRTGGNSVYQALQVAVHGGAARVLLFGCDMRGGGQHWHGRHPEGLASTAPFTYTIWLKAFAGLASILRLLEVDVVNMTPGSALSSFRHSTLEQELG